MKSSRSSSTKNPRRNARKLISESSDESDNKYSSNDTNMDSSRAEKLFSRRLKKPICSTSNTDNTTFDRTLFRVSNSSNDTSSPSCSFIDEKKSKDQKIPITNFDDTADLKPGKKSFLEYRNKTNSSDDILTNSSFDNSNDSCVSKKGLIKTDQSDEERSLDEYVDESIQSTSEKSTPHSFLKMPRNKLRVISDSSDESDIEQKISNNTTINTLNDPCVSKKSLIKTDQSDEERSLDEYVDESIQSTSEKSTPHCFLKMPRNKLRVISDSSDESDIEQKISKNTTINILNDPCVSKKSLIKTDQSDEERSLEEYVDESIQSTSEKSTPHCFLKMPRNKLRVISDSSDESDVEQKISNNTTINETIKLTESESDDSIINSSNEFYPTPMKENYEKPIEKKLQDLSLIENSDLDDTSMLSKSNIVSSNQNRPFFDDTHINNTSHILQQPLSESSVIGIDNFYRSTDYVSDSSKNNKNIKVITLDDDTDEVSEKKSLEQSHKTTIIDLTKDDYDSKFPVSSVDSFDNSRKLGDLTVGNFESLKLEKLRLEEIISRFTKNIENMKNAMKVTNLHLLPDGGLKLKNAILKEENALKDTLLQSKNVVEKLNKFPDHFWNDMEKQKLSLFPKSSDALKHTASSNINIQDMGTKAFNTYLSQQTMTLDVLNNLYKQLKTCPLNILYEDPPELKINLMDHQKHALSWLIWREKEKPHGGILADDMGLGKTLTMISLVLKAEEIEKKKENSNTDGRTENSDCNSIKGRTLIICPSSLMSQWANEIKTKVKPGKIDALQHYGPKRESSPRRLARKDIVITTYHIVMWDYKNHQNTSPLFQIKWKRIILDEAHSIRNSKSQTFTAVCALSGINHWALSGTPIHNKEADFFALLKFIKCHPFDDWAVWKRWVGNQDEVGKSRLSLLVKALMLRRTKEELSKATEFELPPKTFHTVNIELFKEEKEVYEKVLLFSSSLFATYLYEKAKKENAVEEGLNLNKIKYIHQKPENDNIFKDYPELDRLFKQLKKNHDIKAHHILVLILRLRQLCCHPFLMKNILQSENLKMDGIQDTEDLELVDTMSRMSIGAPAVGTSNVIESNPIFNETWVSSKIKAVCDMIKEKVLGTDDKAIIVSQWPSMLNLINKQLMKYHVRTELFSGSVPVLQRNKIVDEFNLKRGPKILLLSLTAGGVGLNLVAANHLFMVDLHWNPQLESQACDRIYRVGQNKPVTIYKFVCSNTIEASIQKIQTHKIEMANNLLGGGNKVEASKITLDDLKAIFNTNPNKKLG